MSIQGILWGLKPSNTQEYEETGSLAHFGKIQSKFGRLNICILLRKYFREILVNNNPDLALGSATFFSFDNVLYTRKDGLIQIYISIFRFVDLTVISKFKNYKNTIQFFIWFILIFFSRTIPIRFSICRFYDRKIHTLVIRIAVVAAIGPFSAAPLHPSVEQWSQKVYPGCKHCMSACSWFIAQNRFTDRTGFPTLFHWSMPMKCKKTNWL